MKTVLVIDDEEKLRMLLARIIRSEGFEVLEAGDCKSGLRKLEQADIDVVLCDVKLPDGNGVDLVKNIKIQAPSTEVILLTAYGNIPDGVQAIKHGAFDYITKGDDNDKIIPLLYRAYDKARLQKRVLALEKQAGEKHSFDSIIGSSKSLLAAIELAKKVAATNTTVLLGGETGTGKEVFAQAIHYGGPRHAKPFVAVNCAVFSKDLLESELFGHKAGAFTGAIRDQKGLFEEADTGTIFLDEIGELAADLQAKLLRVLETGTFFKVGDSKATQVDVRIIAATNRKLHEEVNAGHFRADLFYRLSVFEIQLPPLRERPQDIEVLARSFADLFAAKTNKVVKDLHPDYLTALRAHAWKGNIRELKNILERSVILSDQEMLMPDTLPFDMQQGYAGLSGETTASGFDLAEAEKVHILKVLRHTGGNKSETARLLNIALTTLYRKIEEYKIGG